MFSRPALLWLGCWILQISLGTVQNPILSHVPRLVSRIDYGVDQWPVVFLFVCGEGVYILSYTGLLHANIFLPFMIRK